MKNIIILIFSAVLLMSCEKEISLDLSSPKEKLVIEGRIEKVKGKLNHQQQIVLSTTNDFFDQTQTPRVNDAQIMVSDDLGNAYNFDLDPETEGRYINSKMNPEVGRTYTLEIIWKEQIYLASETLVAVSSLDNAYQQFEEENTFEDGGIKLAIDFTDPANEENFYFWEIFAGNENVIRPDPGNSGNLIAKDQYWDGRKIEGYFPNEEKVFDPGTELVVRHIGISEEYYNYLYLLFEQTGQTGQFADIAPAQVSGNVVNLTTESNFPLGYFSASEIDEKSLVITE